MRVVLTAIALTLATSATGGIEHTLLHGVSVRAVQVWTGPEAIPGLTKESIQSVAELRLREAGIRLDPSATAELSISATTMVSDSGACFASLEAKLLEDARLVRNGLRVEASSWHRGALVSVHTEVCAKSITDATSSSIADFVETFRAMNPAPSKAQ